MIRVVLDMIRVALAYATGPFRGGDDPSKHWPRARRLYVAATGWATVGMLGWIWVADRWMWLPVKPSRGWMI
jgi:hypothetical protein